MAISMEGVREVFANLASLLSSQTRYEGSVWYHTAQVVAGELVTIRPEWSMEVAASVLSAFSPREKWARNCDMARRFARGEPTPCLGMSIRNAHNAERQGFNALKGRKTNAFARAIAGDDDAVVIDTWMLKPLGLRSVTPKQYDMIASVITSLAKEVGMTPRDLQAALWIHIRGSAD